MNTPDPSREPLAVDSALEEREEGHRLQEASSAGAFSYVLSSRRKKIYTAVAVAGSFFGSAGVEAQQPPVLVAAANNNRPVPPAHTPLQRPHLDNAGMQHILDDAGSADQALEDVLTNAKEHTKDVEAHRKAAAMLLEKVEHIDKDPAHAEQLWAFIGSAYKHAKQANDLDLMYRALSYQQDFGVDEKQIIASKVQSFLSAIGGMKANSPEQVALVKFETMDLINDAFAYDRYKDASALFAKVRPILDKAKMKGDVEGLKRVSAASLKLAKDYEKLDKQLSRNPNDPKANTEMGMFYVAKKGAWRQALACFIKGGDRELAQLSQNLLDNEALFAFGAQLQPQDIDRLADMAQAWKAYGDAHREMKNYAYEVVATCYLAVKDKPNNNAQQAAAVAFLGQNKQKPIDLAARGNVMRRLEIPVKSIDLLTQLNTEQFFSGWARPIMKGVMQKDMVSHSYQGAGGHTLFPLSMDGDYILELQVLLGPQPDWPTNEVDFFDIGIPLKDRMVVLSMNALDAPGLFVKGMKLGGLSLVDGRKFPAGAVYEDPLVPSRIPLNVRIKVSFRGDLADISYMRSDGLHKEWTVEISKCHADKFYQDKNGQDLRGVMVSSRSGIRIHEMWLHSMDPNAEVRKVDPNQQAAAPKN